MAHLACSRIGVQRSCVCTVCSSSACLFLRSVVVIVGLRELLVDALQCLWVGADDQTEAC
jgi:hypothetical protein